MRCHFKFSIALGGLLLLVSSHLAAAEPALPPCLPFDEYRKLVVSPTFQEDHTLFSIAIFGLYQPEPDQWKLLRSTDAGYTWTELAPQEAYAVYPSLNYANDHTLFVTGEDPATNKGVLWRSTDGGDTWTLHDLPPRGSDAVAPLDLDLLYVASLAPGLSQPEEGLFHTTDAGATWTQLYRGNVYVLAVSPQFQEDQTLLISPGSYKSSGGIWKSTDGGQTWMARNSGLEIYNPGTGVWSIQYAPGFATNHTVFVNVGGVLFRSTDAGDTWQDLTWAAGLPFTINHQVVSPRYANDQTVWIWEQYGECRAGFPCSSAGTYRSRDGGITWELLPTSERLAVQGAGEVCQADGSCGVQLFARHYSPTDGHLRLYTSFDDGETWQCLGPSPLLVWLPMVFQK